MDETIQEKTEYQAKNMISVGGKENEKQEPSLQVDSIVRMFNLLMELPTNRPVQDIPGLIRTLEFYMTDKLQ